MSLTPEYDDILIGDGDTEAFDTEGTDILELIILKLLILNIIFQMILILIFNI